MERFISDNTTLDQETMFLVRILLKMNKINS